MLSFDIDLCAAHPCWLGFFDNTYDALWYLAYNQCCRYTYKLADCTTAVWHLAGFHCSRYSMRESKQGEQPREETYVKVYIWLCVITKLILCSNGFHVWFAACGEWSATDNCAHLGIPPPRVSAATSKYSAYCIFAECFFPARYHTVESTVVWLPFIGT